MCAKDVAMEDQASLCKYDTEAHLLLVFFNPLLIFSPLDVLNMPQSRLVYVMMFGLMSNLFLQLAFGGHGLVSYICTTESGTGPVICKTG